MGPTVRALRFVLQVAAFSLSLCIILAAKPLKEPAEIVPKPSKSEIQVGTIRLKRCKHVRAYCGTVARPLDPAGSVPDIIKIGLQFYPHLNTSSPALEPIVAMEGGPGYPSTGTRHSYLELFRPLMDRHDLLLVDHRGTGTSRALNCPKLQAEPNPQHEGISACGDMLGPAAYLYGTDLATDDLNTVLQALAIDKVDLYGDSYGTYFSQTFAVRHPQHLHALVLDGAYPIVGLSPWYPEMAPTVREAHRLACQRSRSCRSFSGDSASRLDELVQKLRDDPVSGTAQDGDGKQASVTADPVSVAYLLYSNATALVVYRELDAAAGAYLEQQDSLPLLRLIAENRKAAETGGREAKPENYSAASFVATSCASYPQIYDMKAATADRMGQRENALIEKERSAPNTYAPFTIREFDSVSLEVSVLDLCLNWPQAPPTIGPGTPVPKNSAFPQVPVLVLSGDFDPLTPWPQGAAAAKQFPNAKQVVVRNTGHVSALDDEDNCGSEIVRRFVQSLDAGDTSCAEKVAEVHSVSRFATKATDVDPATAGNGNQADESELRIAAATAQTIGDALARWWVNDSGKGVGLRGGTFKYATKGSHSLYKLNFLRWTDDLSVSGRVDWDYKFPGRVTANVQALAPSGKKGKLSLTWDSRTPDADAQITGMIGRHKVVASVYAPF